MLASYSLEQHKHSTMCAELHNRLAIHTSGCRRTNSAVFVQGTRCCTHYRHLHPMLNLRNCLAFWQVYNRHWR